MKLVLPFILVLLCHLHPIDSRPFFGNVRWSQVHERSVPTVFKNVQGSRYGLIQAHPSRLPNLGDFDQVKTATLDFLNPKPAAPSTTLDFPLISPQDLNELNRDISQDVKAHHDNAAEPELTQEEEDFLLKSLAEGLNLHNDFEKLLYPR